MKIFKIKNDSAVMLGSLKPDWNSAEYLGSEAKPKHVEWVKKYLFKRGYKEAQDINGIKDADWNAAIEYALKKVGDAEPDDPDIQWLLKNGYREKETDVYYRNEGRIEIHANKNTNQWLISCIAFAANPYCVKNYIAYEYGKIGDIKNTVSRCIEKGKKALKIWTSDISKF